MDDLEMPMMFCLLDEMKELPPQDFLAMAEVKAAQQRAEHDKHAALQSLKREKGKVRRRNDGD